MFDCVMGEWCECALEAARAAEVPLSEASYSIGKFVIGD